MRHLSIPAGLCERNGIVGLICNYLQRVPASVLRLWAHSRSARVEASERLYSNSPAFVATLLCVFVLIRSSIQSTHIWFIIIITFF